MKFMLNAKYGLYEQGGRVFCDSLQVAETFERRHDNVLRDIKALDCSEQFRLLNFEESSYKNEQGKRQPRFLMTKDGFTFLVMGYRGAKAAAFKESYIFRFNQMEYCIRDLTIARMECPELTAAINAAHDTPKAYHFSNEMNMLNMIVVGQPAKQIREAHGLPDGESIRPYLTQEQVTALIRLQRFDAGLVLAVPNYNQRKTLLWAYYQAIQPPILTA